MVTDRELRPTADGKGRLYETSLVPLVGSGTGNGQGERAGQRNEDRLVRISGHLSDEYGDPRLGNKEDPLDELVFIILSAKTAERSYLRTYFALKKAFPTWFDILDAPAGSVASAIGLGGLANKKEAQIRALLAAIRGPTGREDLNFLQEMTTGDAEGFLTSLPGVGLKTARCVLMYSLGRDVFPVDTHVRRVLSRLGAIPYQRLTEGVQNSIQQIVPPGIRYKLHVNLIAHGRATCTARNPRCGSCILYDVCAYPPRGGGQPSEPEPST